MDANASQMESFFEAGFIMNDNLMYAFMAYIWVSCRYMANHYRRIRKHNYKYM